MLFILSITNVQKNARKFRTQKISLGSSNILAQLSRDGIDNLMRSQKFTKILQNNLFISLFQYWKNSMIHRNIIRHNSLVSLNKKSANKTLKPTKHKGDEGKENQLQFQLTSTFHNHPAFHYIRGTSPSAFQFKKFATLLYKGLAYSIKNLTGPTEQFLSQKRIRLPEPANSKKKFLVLDLDETLIHYTLGNEKTDVKFNYKGDEFKLNVRPKCLQFLANMSEHFNVYVFTAGTLNYAAPIISFLNHKKKTITGLLHRGNCLETKNGFYIKDLRIIQNRELKDIIMIDNLAHSFGLQVNNGIPILQFIDNKEDRELEALQKMLIQASTVLDVRDYLAAKLQLERILEIPQTQFLTVGQGDEKKL